MDKDYFVNLSFAVYKVTEVFPKDEPLKFKIRKKINDILADLLIFQSNKQLGIKTNQLAEKIVKDIEELRNYFDLAVKECMVNPQNFSVLQKEYSKIYEEMKKDLEGEKARFAVSEKPNKISRVMIPDRRQKILGLVKEKEKLQIKEIQNCFPEINKRTIQRDLVYLVNQGLIYTEGQYNKKFYCQGYDKGMTKGVTSDVT